MAATSAEFLLSARSLGSRLAERTAPDNSNALGLPAFEPSDVTSDRLLWLLLKQIGSLCVFVDITNKRSPGRSGGKGWEKIKRNVRGGTNGDAEQLIELSMQYIFRFLVLWLSNASTIFAADIPCWLTPRKLLTCAPCAWIYVTRGLTRRTIDFVEITTMRGVRLHGAADL